MDLQTYLPELKTRFDKERWAYTKPGAFVPAAAVRQLDFSATQNDIVLSENETAYGTFAQAFSGTENILIEMVTGAGSVFDTQDFALEAGAMVFHLRIHLGGTQKRDVNVTLAEGARYEQFTLTLDTALARCQTDIHLQGKNAHAEVNALCLLQGDEHVDTNVLCHFQAPDCTANVRNRNVITGKAHGVFQGKFHVDQIAQLTDAYMLTENTLLEHADGSFGGRASHKPELEIYADDVKCSHGAATGSLDAEHLFYLQARGIGPSQAKRMLLFAQVQGLLNEIDEQYHPQILAQTNRWLEAL